MKPTNRRLDRTCDSPRDARAYCRRLAGDHYENFTVTLPGLSPDTSQDLANIYAFARWADDLADESPSPAIALEQLDRFETMLEDTFDGHKNSHPVFMALSESIDRCNYSKSHFLDLISAFKQDQKRQRYSTFSELVDYCERSANPVGRLVLETFDALNERTRYYADKTCTALQLTNFWADVAIDYEIGRIYIPEEDRRRFGVDESVIAHKELTDEFRSLMAFEVERTRDWFRVGWKLIDEIGGPIALCVEMFNAGGWAVLDRLEQQNYNVFERRWTLGSRDKLCLGIRGLWRWASNVSIPPG